MKLVIVLAVLIIAAIVYRWYKRTPPQQTKQAIKKAALYGGGAALILLVVTGRLHWLFALLGGLAPFAQRALALLRSYQSLRSVFSQIPGVGGARAGGSQSSKIETAYVRMALDHASGQLTGTVLGGRHRGQRLEELDLEAVLEVLAECRIEDEESVALLEAYLDRRFGGDWRSHAQQSRSGVGKAPPSGMTIDEAYAVLGVAKDATPEQIRDAHRRLMQKLHPDRGGSTYLAAKINQAKDLLLKDAA